jgi:hypothetical protein
MEDLVLRLELVVERVGTQEPPSGRSRAGAAPVKRPILGDSQIWVASSNPLLEALRPSRSAAPPPKDPS